MNVVWILGCRSGSNLLGLYLEACGAYAPTRDRNTTDWNPQWIEDRYILNLCSLIFGNEPNIYVPKLGPPTPLGRAYIPELIDYISLSIKLNKSPTVLFKIGLLPYLWCDLWGVIPKYDTHTLIICKRNRSDQVSSLLKRNPQANFTTVNEFLDRHEECLRTMTNVFNRQSFLVLESNYDTVKATNGRSMEEVAKRLDLPVTDTARNIYKDQSDTTKG